MQSVTTGIGRPVIVKKRVEIRIKIPLTNKALQLTSRLLGLISGLFMPFIL